MRAAVRLAAAAACAALLLPAPAGALPRVEKGKLAAGFDRTAYPAGGKARLGAALTIEDGWHVNAHVPTYDYLIPTELAIDLPEGWGPAIVTYPEAERQSFAFAEEPLDVYAGRVLLAASFGVPKGTPAGARTLAVALTYQACDHESCLPPVTTRREVELVIGEGGEAAHGELFAATAAADSDDPAGGLGAGALASMLLLGVLGGLILNVMPCVLPVLSLKVFGLVKSAGQGRRQVISGALATSAGILASFLALALFAVGARAAGAAVGWGVQFQRPGFVTFLALVVVLFCLNLWGLFEIQLPSSLATALGGGGPREGLAGHFVSGLFATLMATPCSAPFLGPAVGFALSQSAPVIFAVFAAVGVGMALPYLALAAAPGTARFLPRPGAWMETVRKVMGFILAGAAVWLFYVLANQVSPERLASIQLGLLALALFVWARSRVTGAGMLRHAAAAGIVLAAGVALVLATAADAGDLSAAGRGQATAAGRSGLIEWTPFDLAAAERLADSGQLVFVDVTADWCFTCKANELRVLETEETAALFRRHGVVAMKADWTNRDDQIAAFLASHGKYSIPFYVLYRPGGEPLPFSELLSADALRNAIRDAAPRQTADL